MSRLRRWCESLCRPRPDGTWLVRVPALAPPDDSFFVLPDETAKHGYVTRAVRLALLKQLFGPTGLAVAFLLMYGARGLLGMVLGGDAAEDLGDALWLWGCAFLIAAPLVRWWSDGHLRRWARRAGAAAPPDPWRAARVREDLVRQRPAWGVAVEVAAVGAASAGAAAEYLDPCCGGPFAGGLSPGFRLFNLAFALAFGAFMSWMWRDWWRAGRRGA